MALTPIKNTLLELERVFVATVDDTRWVTDRFTLWNLTLLHGRSKLAQALDVVPDGAYTLTAGGAVRYVDYSAEVPNLGRIIPSVHDAGDALTPEGVTVETGGGKLARLYTSETGEIVALDARLELGGYRVHVNTAGDNKPVLLLTGRLEDPELAGIVMPIRLRDDVLGTLRRLGAGVAGTVPA